MKLSIVIPVLNEQDSLRQLIGEIEQTARQNRFETETIFVDDGSSDQSWVVIGEIAASNATVQGLRFRRNFGKSAALAAGIRQSTHEWVVTLDADLQDNIAELPKLISKSNEGFDLVSGWKKVRRDPFSKRIASKIFNWLVNRTSGLALHDHNCGFKLLRRKLFDDLHLYGEWHRFVPMLAASRGWRVAEVSVDHRKRQHGRSKYGWTRFVQGSLDLITIGFLSSNQHRPQRFLGYLGLFSALIGLGGMAYLAVYWLIRITSNLNWAPLHERPLLLYSLGALLVGVHLLALGFLAELMVAQRSDDRHPYSIAETTRQPAFTGKVEPAHLESKIESKDGSFSRIDPPPGSRSATRN